MRQRTNNIQQNGATNCMRMIEVKNKRNEKIPKGCLCANAQTTHSNKLPATGLSKNRIKLKAGLCASAQTGASKNFLQTCSHTQL